MSDIPLDPVLGSKPESIEISNSEIQTFKECRRKWFLGNYLGLQKKDKDLTGPLPLGVRIHNALEAYYTKDDIDLVSEYNRLQRIDALEFLQSDDANDDKKAKKFQDESDLGRIMLEGYVEWLSETSADSGLRLVAAEEKLEYHIKQFHDDRITLIGKVDAIVRRKSDGAVLIQDHKTAATFQTYYETSHMSEQLMLYCILKRLQDDGEKVDGGLYNLLKKVKRSSRAQPPFYDRVEVRFNDQTLASYWTRLMGVLDDMMRVRDALDEGVDHKFVAYPSPSKDCTWKCPFFLVCTMMDDGSSVDRMIPDMYEQVDPLERYKTNEREN